MRSENTSGVSLPAYFAACAGFLGIMCCLSHFGLGNGHTASSPHAPEHVCEGNDFLKGLQEANAAWERQILQEEAELAAERACKGAERQEAWTELRLRSVGLKSEPFLP